MDSLLEQTDTRPILFICHTGVDGAYVTELASHLEREGIQCWYYERDNFGSSIGTAVDKALDECGCLLFVMSKNLPEASIYVQNELNDYVRTRRKIIPLRVSMPRQWWPKGVRSLIGSFPVVDDPSASADSRIVEEIKRRIDKSGRVPNEAGESSSTHLRKTGKKRVLLSIGAIAVIAAAVAASKLPEYRRTVTMRAIEAFSREDWKAGYRWASSPFADKNNANILHHVGILYANGEILPRDDAKAVEYFSAAAEKGDLCAQCSLGIMYESGRGVKTADFEIAYYWFRKAALQGMPEAQYRLAVCYENGHGITKDLNKARDWYSKAAEKGHPKAKTALNSEIMRNVEGPMAPSLEVDSEISGLYQECHVLETQGTDENLKSLFEAQSSEAQSRIEALEVIFSLLKKEYEIERSLDRVCRLSLSQAKMNANREIDDRKSIILASKADYLKCLLAQELATIRKRMVNLMESSGWSQEEVLGFIE